MTLPATPTPPSPGDKPWNPQVDALFALVDQMRTLVQTLSPSTPAVITVAGVTADLDGNVPLTAGDIGAMDDGYKPPLSDFPVPVVIPIVKDDGPGGTGNWPSGWIGRTPVYTGGSPTTAVRPTADAPPVAIGEWVCRDGVFPPTVSSGTGGMLAGDFQSIAG